MGHFLPFAGDFRPIFLCPYYTIDQAIILHIKLHCSKCHKQANKYWKRKLQKSLLEKTFKKEILAFLAAGTVPYLIRPQFSDRNGSSLPRGVALEPAFQKKPSKSPKRSAKKRFSGPIFPCRQGGGWESGGEVPVAAGEDICTARFASEAKQLFSRFFGFFQVLDRPNSKNFFRDICSGHPGEHPEGVGVKCCFHLCSFSKIPS